jgi:poly(3-hydroxybutyrate) depolymerase
MGNLRLLVLAPFIAACSVPVDSGETMGSSGTDEGIGTESGDVGDEESGDTDGMDPGETGEPECGTDAEATLHVGSFVSAEPTAQTEEEYHLSLKPLANIDRTKWFWVYTPDGYDPDCPPPVVIALHPRGSLGSFSTNIEWTQAHLEEYATDTLELWQPIADEHGAMLVVPLGDPDILWMGMSWLAGPRVELMEEILGVVSSQLPFDEDRIFLAGSGEGGHVALATGARAGDRFAAVAAVNPPLFDGASRIPHGGSEMILPQTVPELVADASERRVPMLVLAGAEDIETKLTCHSNSGFPGVCRYEDQSTIPLAHYEEVVPVLAEEFNATLTGIVGPHYRPADATDVAMMWDFLSTYSLK